jgi:transcription initiation factor TFIID TATA-box-binding protein
MPNPKLVNAVGGGSLPQELDLQHLHETFDGEEVRYDPEHWPGLYIRFTANSPAIMIFRTGKYNIAGADCIQQLNAANEEFHSRIQEFGIDVNNASFDIRNLVFLDKYDKELNLDQVVIALGLENAEYEPEQFPGMLYRPTNATGTFMIFRNGKVILTGAKTKDDAAEAFSNLFESLDMLFS